MTQEDKKLVLKDISARVSCGVKMWFPSVIAPIVLDEFVLSVARRRDEEFKPYLRPMSSMTDEELMEFGRLKYQDNEIWEIVEMRVVKHDFLNIKRRNKHNEGSTWTFQISRTEPLRSWMGIDWLNEHHFDYRGLIEKGLALEAPDGMYNKEESEKGSEIPIPKTVDEAVKTLSKIVSKEDREYLLENGAISMHDSMGRWIRNEWGLWADSELKNELKKKGFEHPDDMSNYIIEEFIKYCVEKI